MAKTKPMREPVSSTSPKSPDRVRAEIRLRRFARGAAKFCSAKVMGQDVRAVCEEVLSK